LPGICFFASDQDRGDLEADHPDYDPDCAGGAVYAAIRSGSAGFPHAATATERTYRLPQMLLHAISLAESGRWNKQRRASISWPWPVTAEGRVKYYPGQNSAIAAVRALKAKGIRNIDVGCMQINLMYHKHAFKTVEQAFDPELNTGYTANFLKSLRSEAGSWAHAVARYHSRNWKDKGQSYWRKVYRLWDSEQRREFRERRAERIKRNRAVARRVAGK
jgi:hypothetical protein